MFESLSDRLGNVVSKLRNRGRLSEADVPADLLPLPFVLSPRSQVESLSQSEFVYQLASRFGARLAFSADVALYEN
jgi:hypothetical protein